MTATDWAEWAVYRMIKLLPKNIETAFLSVMHAWITYQLKSEATRLAGNAARQH